MLISVFVVPTQVIDLTIGIRCNYAMEVFGADLMEHNIGGYFDHKTHQIFDSRHNLIGVITKDMEKEQVINKHYSYYFIQYQFISSF